MEEGEEGGAMSRKSRKETFQGGGAELLPNAAEVERRNTERPVDLLIRRPVAVSPPGQGRRRRGEPTPGKELRGCAYLHICACARTRPIHLCVGQSMRNRAKQNKSMLGQGWVHGSGLRVCKWGDD